MTSIITPILSSPPAPLPSNVPPSPSVLPAALQSNQGAQQDLPLMRHQIQVNRSPFYLPASLIQPSIWLSYTSSVIYIFFSIIIQPSINLSLPFLPPFFLVCYNGLLWVGRRIYVGLYLWRREKNKERDLGKHRSRAVSNNVKIWYREKCFYVYSIWLCPSQQLAYLTRVVGVTNRAAFLGFLQ